MAPRGPVEAMRCSSSSLPMNATFSGRNAADTWLGTSDPRSGLSDIIGEVFASTLEHRVEVHARQRATRRDRQSRLDRAQIDLMPEAHRCRVEERGIYGMAIEVH